VERAFNDVGGQFGDVSALTHSREAACLEIDDLRDLVPLRCRDVQACMPLEFLSSVAVCVCLARDGYGVVLRVAEEVAKADSVGAADLLQRVKSGDHVVCFELRQQRSGEARLRCEATKGKILLRAERAQFQAYRVDSKRVEA